MADKAKGLDLSTQQLKGIIVDSNLESVCSAKVIFDKDLPDYKTCNGVIAHGNEIVAPVAMWLDAVDLLMTRLQAFEGVLARLAGISGACQQHGSVFWNAQAEQALESLGPQLSLKQNLKHTLAWQMSPNWQDQSTGEECREFEDAVGGKQNLAEITGSRAHYRFTGPQILKLKKHQPDKYNNTDRISLVSSFLSSVLAGKIEHIEVSDACGMNLFNLEHNTWEPRLMSVIGPDLYHKLGPVELDKAKAQNSISGYFVEKYGVNAACKVVLCTGDNPGTILALPLAVNDVMVSLGTSTTALVITEKYRPSPLYHMFQHPTGRGYMGMLCYCNGSLAREKVRDSVGRSWDDFDNIALSSPALGASQNVRGKLGFYFPLGEIIPDVQSQTRRFVVWPDRTLDEVGENSSAVWRTEDDVTAIIESQALSIRLRLQPLLTTKSKCPSRVFFVGGSSVNLAICSIMAQVLGPDQGAFRPHMTDACAKGAAHRAAWATGDGAESWETFIGKRWQADQSELMGVDDENIWRQVYEDILPIFEEAETHLTR